MNDTKLTIANALLILLKTQPLNKITVTQITKEANLTRQTFYRNFEDKEDLLGCIAESWVDVILRKLTEAFRVSDGRYFEKLCLDSFKEMADQTTLKKALIKKFTFIQSQNTFFKEAFKEDDYNSLTNYDYRCIYDFYKKKIETKTTIDSQLDFLLQMYCHGSIEMTKSWVEKNMYLDIETLVNMLIESMPERLKQYINL